MTMKFLTERLNFDQAQAQVQLVETDKGKNLYLEGIFIQGNVKNHNQRVYPIHEIKRAVGQINNILESGESVFGEADHPEELNINLDRISHLVESMYMEGNNGKGKLKILPTPMGNIVKTILECGGKLGVSSRGSGNVDESGNVCDFEIVTVDIVAKPSAPDAYPRPVYEALTRRRNGRIVEDLAHAVMHDPKAQKHFEKELLNWINNLK